MRSVRNTATLAFLIALVVGCGQEQDDHGHEKDQGAHEDMKGESEIDTALKELGAADEKLAREQKTCPVSGEELGSMGTPIKVSAGDRTVFLCCKGCRERFEKNPERYLKKLD